MDGPACPTTTTSYQSGWPELAWRSFQPKGHYGNALCSLLFSEAHINASHTWLGYVARVWPAGTPGTARAQPSAQEAEMLSRMHRADGEGDWIEPLTGSGRHPLFKIYGNTKMGCREASSHNRHVSAF